MKRIFVLLLALMFAALPALADTAPTGLAFTTDVAEDGSLVFYFDDLEMRLPPEWSDKVVGLPGDSCFGFYHRASYEAYKAEGLEGGGFLFSLGASVNHDFADLPSFRYLGFCENSCMNYFFVLPSDYPAYMQDDIRAEYDAMYAQIDQIADSVVIYGEEESAPQTQPAPPLDAQPETEPSAGQGNKHL